MILCADAGGTSRLGNASADSRHSGCQFGAEAACGANGSYTLFNIRGHVLGSRSQGAAIEISFPM